MSMHDRLQTLRMPTCTCLYKRIHAHYVCVRIRIYLQNASIVLIPRLYVVYIHIYACTHTHMCMPYACQHHLASFCHAPILNVYMYSYVYVYMHYVCMCLYYTYVCTLEFVYMLTLEQTYVRTNKYSQHLRCEHTSCVWWTHILCLCLCSHVPSKYSCAHNAHMHLYFRLIP